MLAVVALAIVGGIVVERSGAVQRVVGPFGPRLVVVGASWSSFVVERTLIVVDIR